MSKELLPFDPNKLQSMEKREEGAQSYEDHLRMTKQYTELQIRDEVNDFRRKQGLPTIQERNLSKEIENWISTTEGEFQTGEIFQAVDIPRTKKNLVSTVLGRLLGRGLITRNGRRTGSFRRIEDEIEVMDLFVSKTEYVDIKMPLDVHQFCYIMPGNIIVVAGGINAGKTAFLLNIIADNMHKYDCHYFNSEMGAGELKSRLEQFDDMPFDEWKAFTAYERSDKFADVIRPGKGKLNLIDFLELYEDFWIVGKRIAEIYHKLNGAVAIIALQKNPGCDFGLGGRRSIEKARLAISLEGNSLKILKAKNWRTKRNPNGREIRFKLVNGCNFIAVDKWSMD